MRRIIAALQTSLDGFIEGLMNANLVDELHLMVTPLVLGGGKAVERCERTPCIEARAREAIDLGKGQPRLQHEGCTKIESAS